MDGSQLLANLSFPLLFVGLILGIFGLYLFRIGKKDGNVPRIVIGLALMIVPYFFTDPILLSGAGAMLMVLAYRMRN